MADAAIIRSDDFTYKRFRDRLRRLLAEHTEALK
jgi:hypothetical protein